MMWYLKEPSIIPIMSSRERQLIWLASTFDYLFPFKCEFLFCNKCGGVVEPKAVHTIKFTQIWMYLFIIIHKFSLVLKFFYMLMKYGVNIHHSFTKFSCDVMLTIAFSFPNSEGPQLIDPFFFSFYIFVCLNS